MFGLFKTKPPLGPLEKAWTESRMGWLAQEFGMSRLLETPTLVPDYPNIPAASNYDETIGVLDFLRAWIKVDAPDVRLQIHGQMVSPEMIAKPDDIDEPIVVTIQEDDFQHRDTLIAALARGLAYGAMSERGLNDIVRADNGWTAELLPAFMGLGAFSANATIHDPNYSDAIYTTWSVARRGPLPSRVFGYAMALRSYVRGDQDVSWATSLRQDAKVAFDEGMKYLDKTNDSMFTRDSARTAHENQSIEALIDKVSGKSLSMKIGGIWGLVQWAEDKPFERNEQVAYLLVDCMRSRDADIRNVATSALPKFDRSPHAAQEVAEALTDPNSDVRAAAAGALGDFAGVDDETLVQDLKTALKDDSDDVVLGAVSSLSRFGDAAEPAVKTVLNRLRRALVNCNNSEAMLFLHVLCKATDNPEQRIRDYLHDSDEEYLEDCFEMLESIQKKAAD